MMESNVPFDTSSPAVRDYLALVRLQVLTPLSLLVNIATLVICTTVIDPSLQDIARDYRTVLTPSAWMVQMYIIAIWVGQIGYCLLLVLVRKPETKQTLIHGSGQWLVWTNWVIAGWAVAFVLQGFLVATILLGIALVLLLFSNLVLVFAHPPTNQRPLDTALIHAPLRLFLILPLMILFWQTLFIALGWYRDPGQPQHYTDYQWTAFGLLMGADIIGLLIVILRRDIVWTVGATWLNAALFSAKSKPATITIPTMVFAILFPLALVASYLILRLRHPQALEATKPSNDPNPRSGPIRLPGDEEAAIGIQGRAAPGPAAYNDQAAAPQAAREVDADAVWG